MYPGCHPWHIFLFVIVPVSTTLAPQRVELLGRILETETLPSQPWVLPTLHKTRAHLRSPLSLQCVLPVEM